MATFEKLANQTERQRASSVGEQYAVVSTLGELLGNKLTLILLSARGRDCFGPELTGGLGCGYVPTTLKPWACAASANALS
jgi:hypothetical protein